MTPLSAVAPTLKGKGGTASLGPLEGESEAAEKDLRLLSNFVGNDLDRMTVGVASEMVVFGEWGAILSLLEHLVGVAVYTGV